MRDIPTSQRILDIRHHQHVIILRLIILIFILVATIIGGLSYYSNDKHLIINKVDIKGTHIIDSDEVLKVIQADLSGRYWHLFARTNSFIYPRKFIYQDLLNHFPRIETLTIERINLQTLQINIVERMGSYLYCGADVPEVEALIGENCYFINNDGFIFDQAPYFSGNIYFKYYLKLADESTQPAGQQLLPKDQFQHLARFIDSVTDLGFKPIYLTLGPDGTNTLYLEHGAGTTAPVIIFKQENDLDLILGNLTLSMKKKEFADEINSKYTTLLYIDLRFKNKVLYKFQ